MDTVKVLFLPYSSQAMVLKRIQDGTTPDTGLMGVNHLPQYGVEYDVLDPPTPRLATRIVRLLRTGAGIGTHIERTLLQQIESLSRRIQYDCILLGSKENVLIDGVIRGFSRSTGPPTIGLDVQLSKHMRFPGIVRLLTSKTGGLAVLSERIGQDLRTVGIPEERIHVLAYGVDDQYFQPREGTNGGEIDVLSVGHACRDYRTLVKAVGDEYTLRIASWGVSLPGGREQTFEQLRQLCSYAPNIQVDYAPYDVLRELYSMASVVAVPLLSTDLCAGITTVLEAMAMAKAPIVTWNRNVIEYVEDEVNGFIVAPGDSKELREKIKFLLDDPETAAAMGRAARRTIEARLSTREEGRSLSRIIKHVVAGAS